ncbi:MAG: pitrilysin family protein [Chlamydiota bacterium]
MARARTFRCVLIPGALALALLPAPLLAGTETPLRVDVAEHRLANGLTLLMIEHRQAPVVSCSVFYRVGSANEAPGCTGISHLLEHMMFKGTRTVGTRDWKAEKPLLDRIEALHERLGEPEGGNGDAGEMPRIRRELADAERRADGLVVRNELWKLYMSSGAEDLNAGTGRDRTQYFCSLPANRIELWMALESDRMRNAVFREFYREREVILEERRLTVDDSPEGAFWEQLFATSLIAHPYRWPVIGWKSDIEHLTLPMVDAWYRRYYAPNNAIVVIAGDIAPRQVIALTERYFGPIPAQPPPPRVVTREPPQRGPREARLALDASPRIALAFHKPAVESDDDIALNVLENILSSGRTSRLYRRLVQEKRVAVSVSASCAPAKYPFLFVIHAIPRRPHTVDDVARALREELDTLMKDPVSDWELAKARNQIEADFVRGLESASELASVVGTYAAIDRWDYVNRYIPRVKAVTPLDLSRVAHDYLTEDTCTTVVIR